MTWTGIARRDYNQECLRYPSDMTDVEWALIVPFVPAARRGGHPRSRICAKWSTPYSTRLVERGVYCRNAFHRSRPSGAISTARLDFQGHEYGAGHEPT